LLAGSGQQGLGAARKREGKDDRRPQRGDLVETTALAVRPDVDHRERQLGADSRGAQERELVAGVEDDGRAILRQRERAVRSRAFWFLFFVRRLAGAARVEQGLADQGDRASATRGNLLRAMTTARKRPYGSSGRSQALRATPRTPSAEDAVGFDGCTTV
jgi:hypothetical protein